MTPDTSCSAPPITPARKACPRALDVGRDALRHRQRDERRQPDRHQHQRTWAGTKANEEKTTSEKAEPTPNSSTTPS